MTEIAVFGTIAAATVAWAIGECRRSRAWWAAGAVLACGHSAAAFAVFHGWSHHAAVVHTARVTAMLTGVEWGGGIYFNYAFLAIWVGDALWWWRSPSGYLARSRAADWAVRFFLFFMFLNGAVVFADGWMRGLGILSLGAVSSAWLIRSFKQAVPAR